MPPTARSKPMASTKMKTKPVSESAILDALSDPSKCDAELARRLANALHLDDRVAPPKPNIKGKQKAGQTSDDAEERRRLAMRAANVASQSLGTVVQSGWKALDLNATSPYSLSGVLSIASSFKLAISLLRELMPGAIDVERVASGFTGKLIAIQVYEHALDLLEDIKTNVIRIYHGSPPKSKSVPKKLVQKASSSSLDLPLHLILYPLPSPEDPTILGLIGTSLGQAATTLAALVARAPANHTTLEAFAAIINEHGSPLSWIPHLPEEIADTLMTRAHRALATGFSSSNTSSAVLLRLRTWALKCLLCKLPLDSELFWTQAANYMVSHGKSVSKSEDVFKTVEDILALFESVVFAAQERHDAATFMSGPAFVKCCEVALVYAQRSDNAASLNRVVRFITATESAGSESPSTDIELDNVKLSATFTRCAAFLEHSFCDGPEDIDVKTLADCTKILSGSISFLSRLDPKSNVGYSVEKLRRVCGKAIEEGKGPDQFANSVKDLLVSIIKTIESVLQKPKQCLAKDMVDLTARAVDSLCTLAKLELIPAIGATHFTTYNHLQRAVTLLEYCPPSVKGKGNADSSVTLANVVRCLSGAFWRHAIALYRDDKYAPAIRFLVQACELGMRAYETVGEVELDQEHEVWKTLQDHLPKRWELLGDCYSKIGDRRLAHNAFLESLKIRSFDSLCDSAASSSPNQISSDEHHRRLASVVERITYIAVSDLFMKAEGSLRQTLCTAGVKPEAVGLLLEWQVNGLEQSMWKEEIRPVVTNFLNDALEMYGMEFPIRRARVLVRQLELTYRADDMSLPAMDLAKEIHSLLSKPLDTGKDAALAYLQPQYQASAHMWMVFHAHRRSENNSHSALILQHATLASRILQSIFPATPVHHAGKSPRISPKAATTKTARMPCRTSPRKKASVMKPNPVTPKPRKMALQTPPKVDRQASAPKLMSAKFRGPLADSHLTMTIQMLAQLLGLLGHVFLKIQYLNILQRMTECSIGLTADDFVRASVEAAVEYVRLGKMQRALAIYKHALAAINSATTATVSEEVRILLLLHYAESLALSGEIEKSSSLYEEARNLAQELASHQPRSTVARIRARVLVLEQSALASNVFSVIQIAQDDPHAAFTTLRQGVRLWNRAFDSLSRLSPIPIPVSTSNPFDMSSLAEALPPFNEPSQQDMRFSRKTRRPNMAMDGLQWRVADGLLRTLFGLAQAYFLQGTIKAAEYFTEQAYDLAASLKAPAMMSRALARKGELQLYQGKTEDAAASLLEAAELLDDLPGIDAADVNRLRAHYSQLMDRHKEAKTLYLKTVSILSDLEKTLSTIDNSTSGPRKSLTQSPGRSHQPDVLVPGFLATVLRQQIWLERNEPRVKSKALLDQLVTLPSCRETKAEEVAILAKLALHDAHVQFRADLFLSSLSESTIAMPMGISSHNRASLSPGGKQMLGTLSTAEKMFWANLEFVSNRGQASHVREAAVSLALIQAFQTSLGQSAINGARVAAGLLDSSAAITLRRELVDDIEQKFPELAVDDLVWPTYRKRAPGSSRALQFARSVDSDQIEERTLNLMGYWRSVRERYYSTYDLEDQSVSLSQVDQLPANWTVVSINITEDKNTMFFSRQRPDSEPLVFCVPLERHGRKEEDTDEQFSFADAKEQLNEILQESNLSAKNAKDVPSEDRDAKAAWWAKRFSLDKRLRELLENIEFCWLGAFKTILSDPVKMPPDILSGLRARFDKVFKHNLGSDKKRLSRMQFHDALLECFASLSPKCRDEELEDLIYFVLDLYQFHGVHIALSEIDMDQLTVELRTALEEHASKCKGRVLPEEDAHLFLVLDKNVQDIPWESIPVLRGRSVSRIPSLSFLIDRLEFAKLQRESAGLPVQGGSSPDRAMVNPQKTFYVLNPSGDLNRSETRFRAWLKDMEAPAVGWQGIVGRVPSEQELLNAFTKKDLVIYVGHGGAEQYVRSHKIKHLPRCAATMLWGCSSGLMREMGDFDRVGTPYNYMLAGCPTLVACLWDVTDNELDKFSHSVFEKLRLDVEHVKTWSLEAMDDSPVSLVAAVGQSRDVCKLKYLTGAAPVVYGIPFYL